MKPLHIISSIVLFLGSIAFQLSLALWPQQVQPYAWAVKYVWMAWALTSLLGLIVWLGSKNSNEVPSTAAVPPITFAPVITQIANPVGSLNHTPQELPTPPPPTRVALDSNLVCTGVAVMALSAENLSVFSELSDSRLRGSLAGVVTIANRPTVQRSEIAAIQEVKAQVIFRSAEQEVYSGFGTWLDHFSNKTDFPAAQSQRLVLVVQDDFRSPGLVFGITNPRSYTIPSRPWSAMKHALENAPPNGMYELKEESLDIEVTLLDGGRTIGEFLFEYRRADEGPFTLTRKEKKAAEKPPNA